MQKRQTLMWLSDSPFLTTGYATISKNVCNRLNNWNVNYLAHTYFGQDVKPGVTFDDDTTLNFKVIGQGREQYCKDVILPKLNEMQPNVFAVLLDTFMLYPWLMEMNFSPAKSIFYFPSDGGGGMPLGCENILRHVTLPIAMSKFGQRQVKQYHGIDTEYIPHAVDTSIYYPLPIEDKIRIRNEFVIYTVSGQPIQGILRDKFVVGCVARNQGRKMLDRALKAFKIFCKDKPNAVLLFHADAYDAAAVFDLPNLIRREKLENRVFFTGTRYFKGFNYKDMNKVYNIMDIFLLPTSGEGFGIPIIEAMACKVPVVCTDYTTTPEFLIEGGQCGLPVKLAGTEQVSMSELLYEKGYTLPDIDVALANGTITGSWNVERGMMDINHCAECLTALYANPLLREQFGSVGRQKVLREYDWNVVMKKWEEVLDRLTND